MYHLLLGRLIWLEMHVLLKVFMFKYYPLIILCNSIRLELVGNLKPKHLGVQMLRLYPLSHLV